MFITKSNTANKVPAAFQQMATYKQPTTSSLNVVCNTDFISHVYAKLFIFGKRLVLCNISTSSQNIL